MAHVTCVHFEHHFLTDTLYVCVSLRVACGVTNPTTCTPAFYLGCVDHKLLPSTGYIYLGCVEHVLRVDSCCQWVPVNLASEATRGFEDRVSEPLR